MFAHLSLIEVAWLWWYWIIFRLFHACIWTKIICIPRTIYCFVRLFFALFLITRQYGYMLTKHIQLVLKLFVVSSGFTLFNVDLVTAFSIGNSKLVYLLLNIKLHAHISITFLGLFIFGFLMTYLKDNLLTVKLLLDIYFSDTNYHFLWEWWYADLLRPILASPVALIICFCFDDFS